jgi:hypothetical protein
MLSLKNQRIKELQRNTGYYEHPMLCWDTILNDKILRSLKEATNILCTIPEDDAIWQIDYAPLIIKEYFEQVIINHPDDDNARWALIAAELIELKGNFASEFLEPLVQRDITQICWLIATAIMVWDTLRVETFPELKESLLRLKKKLKNFEEDLKQLTQHANSYIKYMSQIAVFIIDTEKLQPLRNQIIQATIATLRSYLYSPKEIFRENAKDLLALSWAEAITTLETVIPDLQSPNKEKKCAAELTIIMGLLLQTQDEETLKKLLPKPHL